MLRSSLVVLAGTAVALLAAGMVACDGGGGGRVIQITQTDDACTPQAIEIKSGENVRFEIKNEGKKDHEVEGIEGMKLEELLVPAGRTRHLDYTGPKQEGVQKIKCYIPGGSATIIEVTVAGTVESANETGGGRGGAKTRVTDKPARDTVTVQLSSYAVAPEKASAASGPVKFVAENVSTTDVHELAVLRTLPDGGFENTGEIEDIEPGKSGEVTIELPPGQYLLACVIVPGESGSTVDHFAKGMKTSFEVK